MKYLHIINNIEIGGAEILLKDLSLSFKQKGHEIHLFLLQLTGEQLEKELIENGVTILNSKGKNNYSIKHFFYLLRILKNYDIVHVHLFPAQLWVALASFFQRKKTITVTTEHSTLNRRRKRMFYFLDQWMYNQFDAIICISEATAKGLTDRYCKLENRIHIIYNGVSTEKFLFKENDNRDNKPPYILSIGRLDEVKNQAVIIKALTLIPDVHLILVGSGKLQGKLEELTNKLNITERVHFLGTRTDIPEIISQADIYVQASKWEGFGIAAVEAMAGGMPIIASEVPGLKDVIGNAGLFFHPEDPQDLAAKINHLLDHPSELQNLKEKSLQRAELFSIDNTVKQYLNVYEQLLKNLHSNG